MYLPFKTPTQFSLGIPSAISLVTHLEFPLGDTLSICSGTSEAKSLKFLKEIYRGTSYEIFRENPRKIAEFLRISQKEVAGLRNFRQCFENKTKIREFLTDLQIEYLNKLAEKLVKKLSFFKSVICILFWKFFLIIVRNFSRRFFRTLFDIFFSKFS